MPLAQQNTELVKISNIKAQITRKRIKHINLSVCPPRGEVRISAPYSTSDKRIFDFLKSRIEWIHETRKELRKQKFIPKPKFIDGEKHFFLGQKFVLKIYDSRTEKYHTTKRSKKNSAILNDGIIELYIEKRSTMAARQKIIEDFYRTELKKIIPYFIIKFEQIMNRKVSEFGIKKMKTRWGTCNMSDRRIWINLELAKYPIKCLEYIVAHEMTHFFEASHNRRFFDLMTRYLPEWKKGKDELDMIING